MLESTIVLLGDLLLSAVTLLIGSCIVGSIVAALWAVTHGRCCEYKRVKAVLGFMPQVNGLG